MKINGSQLVSHCFCIRKLINPVVVYDKMARNELRIVTWAVMGVVRKQSRQVEEQPSPLITVSLKKNGEAGSSSKNHIP